MKKFAVTKQGYKIPLIHKSIFSMGAVSTGQSITATNGKKEFVFDVLVKTQSFLICINPEDGKEYAFDHSGLELERFKKFKLIAPCFNFFIFPTYYLIDENYTIIDSAEAYYPSFQQKEKEIKGSRIINRTFRGKGDAPSTVIEVNGLGESFFHGFKEDEHLPFEIIDA